MAAKSQAMAHGPKVQSSAPFLAEPQAQLSRAAETAVIVMAADITAADTRQAAITTLVTAIAIASPFIHSLFIHGLFIRSPFTARPSIAVLFTVAAITRSHFTASRA